MVHIPPEIQTKIFNYAPLNCLDVLRRVNIALTPYFDRLVHLGIIFSREDFLFVEVTIYGRTDDQRIRYEVEFKSLRKLKPNNCIDVEFCTQKGKYPTWLLQNPHCGYLRTQDFEDWFKIVDGEFVWITTEEIMGLGGSEHLIGAWST